MFCSMMDRPRTSHAVKSFATGGRVAAPVRRWIAAVAAALNVCHFIVAVAVEAVAAVESRGEKLGIGSLCSALPVRLVSVSGGPAP